MPLTDRRKTWAFAALGLGCFALLLTLEIATESDELSPLDVAIDALGILLTIGAAGGVAIVAVRLQAQHEEKLALVRDLATARAEGNGWRNKVRAHLAGLKAGVDQQFHDWHLTPAEREVGLLLLKGLSHKEIASLRASTEATVRQQAQSIYRKAKLPGKTAFVAYFLEDLFVPEDEIDLRPVAADNGLDWHRAQAELRGVDGALGGTDAGAPLSSQALDRKQ